DYLHLLEDWKVRYAPKTPEDSLNDRFVEACQMHCHIEYMAGVLTVGSLEERTALVDKLMKGGTITFLKDYTARNSGEQNASAMWNPKEQRMQKRTLIRHRPEMDCAKVELWKN
ncbi:MAG: hypothetical protein Q4A76_06800, partial [Porphyromonadaceae bacterium]|nr:hypothetical protein [Porphyromonadaceae bacterium]